MSDKRELELERGVQTFVDSHLQAKGIEPLDGLKQRTCQTGEEYMELVVHASGVAELTQALAGAVAAFGSPGCRCYWRVRADLEQRLGEGDRIRAYVRFRMTTKPELDLHASV
jgi:hypothetical protein